jgi:uncharacterized protein
LNPLEYAFPDALIQVFCKAPIAGQVKTRLMPQLSAGQAVAIHQQLTLRTLALVSSPKLCPVQLWCTPSSQQPFFMQAAKDYALSLHTQTEGDLGERMDAALRAGLNKYAYVVLIGCDCPSLTVEDLSCAITALRQGNDVVIAPTEDGGYSLIGLTEPQPALFKGIDWSTAAVMAQTRLQIAALNLRSLELNLQWDVDTYADYLRFMAYEA